MSHSTPVPRSVYFMYSNSGELLYIGCSNHVPRRLSYHEEARAPWLADVDRIQVAGPWPHIEAYAIESDLIAEHQPRYNVKSKESASVDA